MNKELTRLIFKRYWKFLITFFIIVMGSYLFMANNQVSRWRQQEEYFTTGWGEKNYQELINNPEDAEYYNSKMSFEDYRKQQIKLFQTYYTDGSGRPVYAKELADPVTVIFFMAIITGLLAFFYDYKTNFNAVIFSSKYSRKQFYWHKTLIFSGLFVGIILLSKIIHIIYTKTQIPATYYNASWLDLLPSILASTLLYLVIFLVAMVAGLTLGELVTTLITLPIFIFSFIFFFNSIDTIITVIKSSSVDNIYYSSVSRNVQDLLSLSITPVHWLTVSGLSIAAIFLLGLGRYLFVQLSLENTGQFVLISKLKLPLLIFLVLYGTFTFSIQGFAVTPSLFNTYLGASSFAYFLKNSIFLGFLLSIAGYLLIYRDFKFKNIRELFKRKQLY